MFLFLYADRHQMSRMKLAGHPLVVASYVLIPHTHAQPTQCSIHINHKKIEYFLEYNNEVRSEV